MNEELQEIEALASDGVLQERMEVALKQAPHARAVVGFATADAATFASVGLSNEPQVRHIPVPLGCLVKLFTCSLVQEEVANARIRYDDPIERFFPSMSDRRSVFSDVSVKHAIEHTHGWNSGAFVSAPLSDAGFIDIQALEAGLGSYESIARPGALYNYSDVGPWAIAAALESLNGACYEEIVRRQIWKPLGIEAVVEPCGEGSAPRFSPATGEALSMPAADLLTFLTAHFRGGPRDFLSAEVAAAHEQITPLPGWSAFERGVWQGWKSYGEGWFGHSSTIEQMPALVRVHPLRKLALLVACAHAAVVPLAASLFSKLTPEFAATKIPKLLQRSLSAEERSRYIGTYHGATATLVVAETEQSELQLRAYNASSMNRETSPFFVAVLTPAKDDIFLPRPIHRGLFPIIQFVREARDGAEYAWNGQSVFRKTVAA